MKRLVRILAIGAVLAAGATALPSSASAGTFTKITSPKGPGGLIYQFVDAAVSNPTMSVSGQTSVDVTTNVNIYCYMDNDRTVQGPLNSSPIPVNTSTSPHTFSATGVSTPTTQTGCVLRAIPDTFTGISGSSSTGYVAAYSGPTFYKGSHQEFNSSSSRVAYLIEEVQQRAFDIWTEPDLLGVFFQIPSDDFSKNLTPTGSGASSGDLILSPNNLVDSGGTPTRSQIRVDGVNAYLPLTLAGYASDPTTVPSGTFKLTRSASTGNVTTTESWPLRTCGATYPQSAGTCTTVHNPGVTMKRSVVTSAAGAVMTIHDAFVNTNHAQHTIQVEYSNSLTQQTNGQVGVKLPGRSWRAPPSDTTVSNLPNGPHTVFVSSDLDAVDGQPDHTDAGITYSGKPIIRFNNANGMAFRYTRTVPKGGHANFAFGIEGGFSLSTVTGLANAMQKALTPHLVLTRPARTTSDNTPTIRGKVTNATNGFPAKVAITIGTRTRTVNVAQTGSAAGTFAIAWIQLANGIHTAKAKASDPSGFVMGASRRFRIT